MTKRTNFSLAKTTSTVSRPSVFDRIVHEVDATEVPAKYIDQILVQYDDGSVIELSGDEIALPMPTSKGSSQAEMDDAYKAMRDVKVFINIGVLESDVNELVESYLGKYC